MDAMKVNSFVAATSPPEGPALSRYLAAAGRALGGRSDATLAKAFGFHPTTLASWKRRGKLPPDAAQLLMSTLPTKIIHRGLQLPDASKVAREAVIILIRETRADPLRLGQERAVEGTAYFLGGLLAMAEFLRDTSAAQARTAPEIAEIMREGFTHLGSDARFAVASGFPF